MHDILAIGKLFNIDGELQTAVPYGSGYINDTYLATYQGTDTSFKLVHQRINHYVFRNPVAVMENFEVVVAHLARKVQAEGKSDWRRRVLSWVPGKNGRPYVIDDDGNYWRTTHFIPDTVTYDVVQDDALLFEAGRAFGHFQKQLADLPASSVVDTIPDFHNTRWRFEMLKTAVAADPCNRAQFVKEEIAFAQAREPMVDVLLDLNAAGEIPTRVIHNDTKINNLLFDAATGEAVCVTDLDTVMQGLTHYDFGDLVRTTVSLTADDEKNLDIVYADINRFRPIAHGYLSATHDMLNPTERHYLPLAGRLITFENGIRFLTDYLQGDTYFKTQYPDHNRDRTRAQFKIVASLEEQTEAMQKIVDNWSQAE